MTFTDIVVSSTNNHNDNNALALSSSQNNALIHVDKRTSSLQSPTVLLTGHAGEIYSCKFDPSGQFIASGSADKCIFLWNTYGKNENYAVIREAHKNAVTDIQWTRDSSRITSASADHTVAVFDTTTCEKIFRGKEHSLVVNSVHPARNITSTNVVFASGSDDGYILIWDTRSRDSVHTLENIYPVTSVCFSHDGDILYSAGIDNQIKVWDIKKNEILYTLKGHYDTITGISLSPDGNSILSASMDNSVRTWDVKPFCAIPDRMTGYFEGAPHGFDKTLIKPNWSCDGKLVGSGASDRTANVWDAETKHLLYHLPGHKGVVNEVCFHPTEPIVLSCSSDKTMYLGEMRFTPDEILFGDGLA